VGSQGLNLSGGQRQRIGVARALLVKPDLLIFDEATNAVDALSDMEIVKLATEQRHFQTLLIISHRKSTIAACQYGIVLEDGKVVETGPLEGLAYFRQMAGTPTI
jgi:subfamily B ATP-binding cassette protein MsbA